jgi:hypothetical protein
LTSTMLLSEIFSLKMNKPGTATRYEMTVVKTNGTGIHLKKN